MQLKTVLGGVGTGLYISECVIWPALSKSAGSIGLLCFLFAFFDLVLPSCELQIS